MGDDATKAMSTALNDASNAVADEANELSSKAQKLYADATTLMRERTTDSPLAAVGIALLAGFFVGVIWSSGSNASRSADVCARQRNRRQGNDY
jgi:ElaB/YqjD/DUF883 family membrane-anchored ribosome-binding protein